MQRYDCKKPVFVCKTPFYVVSPECVQGQIPESDIEAIVFDTVRRQIELFADADRIRRDEADSSEFTRRNISEQIQEAQKSLQTLSQNRLSVYERYKDEQIKREAYLHDRELLNWQIGETEKQIQALELESVRIISPTPESIGQAYMQFAGATHITREMVDCLVESIIVYNGSRIEIKLKTTDEFANIDNI
jgi:hypothetical protein